NKAISAGSSNTAKSTPPPAPPENIAQRHFKVGRRGPSPASFSDRRRVGCAHHLISDRSKLRRPRRRAEGILAWLNIASFQILNSLQLEHNVLHKVQDEFFRRFRSNHNV